MPRFVRNLEDNGKEILAMSEVKKLITCPPSSVTLHSKEGENVVFIFRIWTSAHRLLDAWIYMTLELNTGKKVFGGRGEGGGGLKVED